MLDGVICSMDVRIAIFKCSFKYERSWVSVPRSRAMIGAGIAANAVHTLDVGVLRHLLVSDSFRSIDLVIGTYLVDDTTDVLVKSRISEVSDQTKALGLPSIKRRLGITNHVLV